MENKLYANIDIIDLYDIQPTLNNNERCHVSSHCICFDQRINRTGYYSLFIKRNTLDTALVGYS